VKFGGSECEVRRLGSKEVSDAAAKHAVEGRKLGIMPSTEAASESSHYKKYIFTARHVVLAC